MTGATSQVSGAPAVRPQSVRGVAILDLDLSAKNDAQLRTHGLPPTWRALAQRLTASRLEVEFLNPGRGAAGEAGVRLCTAGPGMLLLHVDNFLPPFLDGALRRLKGETPALRIVACGYLATVGPGELMERLPAVDAAVRGPLEAVLPALARALCGDGELAGIPNYVPREEAAGARYVKPFIPADSLGEGYLAVPHVPLTAIGSQAGVGIVQGSAGCPCCCAFCRTGSFYRAYSRNPYALRPIEDLIREIDHLARSRGIRHFKLFDNNFLGTPRLAPRRARALADGLRRLDLPLTFELHCRTEAVVPEVLAPLREAGLRHLALGIESMSPRQLARYEKGETVEQHRRAAELISAYGLMAQGYTILADPLVSREELAESLAGLHGLAEHVLILIHERMILYVTAPYWARHGDAIPGVRTLPSSLHTVIEYEFADPWCRRCFPLFEEASQGFKRALADYQRKRLPGLTGPELHRFVRLATRARIELLQRIVEHDAPTPEAVAGWLAAAEERIPSMARSTLTAEGRP